MADDMIVSKNTAKRLVTAPVAIPECPDCDFYRGEKIFTADEIENMVHEYNTKYRHADEMHVLGKTGETIGHAVENWTTKEPTTVKNIDGKTVKLPVGTWMSTVKITDNETWSKIEDGTYRGFSAMYVPKDDAERFKAEKRTLVKDLKNPVPVSIAVVDNPCVFDAIFTSVKVDPAGKAGRSISNSTLDKIQSTYDKITSSVDGLKDLIDKAKGERPEDTEVFEMDITETQLNDKINEAVKEAREDDKKEIESLKSEIEDLKKGKKGDPGGDPAAIKCTACKHELSESDKFCPACGDKIESEKPSEVESLKKEFEEFKKNSTKSNDATFEYKGENKVVSKRSEKRDSSGVPKRPWD